MSNLNRALIVKLIGLGPVMGILNVIGAFPQGWERYAWVLVAALVAIIVARNVDRNAFGHGAVIGFINGAISTLIQGIFVNTWVANNPWVLDEFADMPEGFDLQFFVIMLVPFIGVAAALAGGLFALLASRIVNQSKADAD